MVPVSGGRPLGGARALLAPLSCGAQDPFWPATRLYRGQSQPVAPAGEEMREAAVSLTETDLGALAAYRGSRASVRRRPRPQFAAFHRVSGTVCACVESRRFRYGEAAPGATVPETSYERVSPTQE
jgi:hypothetical protein